MKKSKNLVLSVLLSVCAFCLCFALVGCSGGGDDKTDKYGYGEEGFYYYDGANSARYMLSLQSGTYMITMNGASAYSGTYSYDEESGTVSFKGDNEFAATLGESALSLSVGDSGYSFKAYKFFDVTYVDETGNTIATESVLNGQTAVNLDIEKDGYWFIDWYADSSNSATYSFDTSIAGDTTIYGWYIEKNTEAVEHTITLDYGDGVTEVWDTTNGAIYKTLPESHDGKAIIGWWVSATNKSGELTYKYAVGDVFDADTTLFAVYSGIGSSVTSAGVTWDAASAGSNVSIEIKNSDGETVISESSLSSTSGVYTSSAFTGLASGVYTVEVTSGSMTDTLVYVVNGLARVTLSESDVVINGSGRVLSFAPVDGADGYLITVTNGERTVTEDLGSHTYYNFSSWEMTKEGITFVVTAYGEGYAESVSDAYTYIKVLGDVTVSISDDVVSWNRVEGALEYAVTITDVDGIVIDSFYTSDTSFSLKYYENGTYDITVQPHTDGYYSEARTYYGYAKDSLKAPQITNITSTGISWEDVGADYYIVVINGVTYGEDGGITSTTLYFSESSLPESKDGKYEISVKAVKTGGSDSPYSDVVVATVEFSSAVSYDRNMVYWNYDIEATSYGISVNGGTETVVTEGNSAKVTLTKVGDNTITVTAYDEDGAIGYAETTVYAYSITLDPNGAELINDTAVNGVIYVAQGDELDLGTVEKDYADFMGWYTQADYTDGQSDEYEGKGSLVEDGSTFTGSSSMYLYAYWSYEYVEVTLVMGMGLADDGTGAKVDTMTVSIKYNSPSFTLPVPTPNNAEDAFEGWYTRANGQGVKYASTDGASLAGAAYGGETTLYAYYLAVLYYSKTTYRGQTVYSVSAGSTIDGISEITIPEKYTVNGASYDLIIKANAFKNCGTLVTINIYDTVQYIATENDGYRVGTGAFVGCSRLQAVNVIPTEESVEPVYFSADGVLFAKTGETDDVELMYYPYAKATSDYSIPAYVTNTYETDYTGAAIQHAVTTLPTQVFRDRVFAKVTIPSTVTYIAASAFYSNRYLTEVVFAEGGTESLTIEDGAFRSCTFITKITIPARYTDFNAAAFSGCTALTWVDVENGGSYTSSNGVLLNATGTEIVYYPAGLGGEVNVAEISTTITAIGKSTFAGNTNITAVTIPGQVTLIDESAFENCTGMMSLTFAGNANSGDLTIKANAFYGCVRLSSVELPQNLVAMEKNAFGGCTSLVTVSYNSRSSQVVKTDLSFATGSFGTPSYIVTLNLGAYVPDIDFASIFGTDALLYVNIAEDNQSYYSDENGVVYNAQKSTIIFFPSGWVGEYELLEDTTEIGSNVFKNNTGLTSVKLGKNVSTIGADAFAGCTALKSIIVDADNSNFGNGTTPAGDSDGILYAKDADTGAIVELIYCPIATEYTEIVVAASVTKVAVDAFYNNAAVKTVKFLATTSFEFETDSYTSDQAKTRSYTFYCASSGTSSLTSVILPDCMTSIPAYSFMNCDKLVYVSIPASCTEIGDYAFRVCSSLVGDLTDPEDGITLPEGLETVGYWAFYNDLNLAVTIPSTVTYIDNYAFYCCWGGNSSSFSMSGQEFPIVFASAKESDDENELHGDDGTPAEATLTIKQMAFRNTQYATGVEIPKRVTAIEQQAFMNMGISQSSIATAITFEEGSTLTELSTSLFSGDKYMKEIKLPDSVTVIGDSALTGCSALETVEFSAVTQIGDSAFNACTSLTSFEVPASVTSIGTKAFYGCTGLSSFTFAEGASLATIGNNAFNGCTSLTKIELPESVETINYAAFDGCSGLTEFVFGGDREGGNGSKITELDTLTFRGCKNLTSITLPSGLVTLGKITTTTSTTYGVFENCTGLTSISIPASVEEISEKAFRGCKALASVTFEGESSLGKVGDYAFQNCTKLTSFAFPESTASSVELGTEIFAGSGLKTLTLSGNITDIGTAFQGLILDNIYINEGNTSYAVDSEGSPVLYSLDSTGTTKTLTYVFGELSGVISVPDGVTAIGVSAYYGQTKVTGVEIPSSVESLGGYAFYGCTALEKVDVKTGADGYGNLRSLGAYCFSGCKALKSINLPESVTEIPEYCFDGCDLSETTLPDTLKTVGNYAFNGTGLLTVDMPSCTSVGECAFNESGIVTAKFGTLSTMATKAFYKCYDLEEIDFDGSFITLTNSVFYYCTSLTYVRVPDTVTTLDTYAFEYSGVEKVDLPNGLTTVNNYAFAYCYSLEEITLPGSITKLGTYIFKDCTSLTEIAVPDGVTSVGNYDFDGCASLVSCTLPEDAKSLTLGTYVFRNCSSLTEITLPKVLTSIGNYCFQNTPLEEISFGSALTSIGNYAFSGCANLETVTVGGGVTSLGTNVFENCTSLTYAYTGDLVSSVGASAFSGCTALESVDFGLNLNSIGASAFSGCTVLKSVDLGSYLTSIGDTAFEDCTSIESVIIPSTVSSMGKQVFSGTEMTLYIAASAEYVSLYWTPGTTGKSTWDSGFNGKMYFYSETEPGFNDGGTSYDGDFWHYDELGYPEAWTFAYATYTVEDGGYVLYDGTQETISYVCLPDDEAGTSTVYAVSECNSDTANGTYSVTLSNGESYTVTLSTGAEGALIATVTPVTG